MADKTLVWHYAGVLQKGTHDLRQRRGGATAYVLDEDYHPREVRISLGEAPVGAAVVLDINDDGVSIFDSNPQVDRGTTSKVHDVFSETGETTLAKDSVLTLDVDSVAPGAKSLTVELDLDKVE